MNPWEISDLGTEAQCQPGLFFFLINGKLLAPSRSTLVLPGPFPLTVQEMRFISFQLNENSGNKPHVSCLTMSKQQILICCKERMRI